MLRKTILSLLLFQLLLFSSAAFDRTDPERLLGLQVGDIFQSEDHPSEIFPSRGVEADEDNVVFYYEGGFYLFLFNSRVWQVRYDRTYSGMFKEVSMGMDRTSVLSATLEAGKLPVSTGEDYVTFQLADSPYPVRMKLFFTEDKLDDLYVYRADF